MSSSARPWSRGDGQDHAFSSSDRSQRRVTWVLALLVFCVAAVPRLTDLDVFIGPDEFSWVTRPANFFWALSRGDLANTFQSGHPGVFLMWVNLVFTLLKYAFAYVTGGQPDLAALVGPENSMAMLATKRWEMGLVSTLMVVGMFLVGRRAFNTPIALLGALLVALDPFFLVESRQLRTEAPAAGLMMLSLLAFMAYLRGERRRYVWLSGVLAALAALARIPALFLLPFYGLWLGAEFLGRWQSDRHAVWRSTLYAALVCGLVPLVLIVLLWPALWAAPVRTISTMLSYTEAWVGEGKQGAGVFFMEDIYPDDPGWFFYPVALLFGTTPLVWIGVVAAVGVAVFDRVGRSRTWPLVSDVASQWFHKGVLILLLYGLLYTFMISLSTLKFQRYLSPVLPALDFVTAIGLFWLAMAGIYGWRKLRKHTGRLEIVAWPGVALVVIVAQGVLCWANHPYYYTYYNPWMGGIQRAQQVLRIGYGEGLDQVAAYLNAKPDANQIKLASAMSSRIGPILAGDTIPMGNLDGRWIQADYVFVYISQLQRGKHDPEILEYLARQEPEFVLRLHGVEYGQLYPGPKAQHYSGARLEGRGTLYGYDLSATQLRAGEALTARLYWRNEGQQPEDAFFVGVADAAGYMWVTAMAQPRPGFEEAARVRGAIVESEAILNLPVGMPPGQYFLKMGFVADSGQTLVGWFELPADGDDVSVTLPDTFPSPNQVLAPHALNLSTRDIAVLGYDLSPTTVRAGDRGWLTLFWQAKQDAPQDYVVSIRLLTAGGQETTYWLGRPVYSGYATSAWRQGQIVQDPWELWVPAEVSAGDYQLELVLYDGVTQETMARTPLERWAVESPEN